MQPRGPHPEVTRNHPTKASRSPQPGTAGNCTQRDLSQDWRGIGPQKLATSPSQDWRRVHPQGPQITPPGPPPPKPTLRDPPTPLMVTAGETNGPLWVCASFGSSTAIHCSPACSGRQRWWGELYCLWGSVSRTAHLPSHSVHKHHMLCRSILCSFPRPTYPCCIDTRVLRVTTPPFPSSRRARIARPPRTAPAPP